jgi:tRNA G18 (ribose-2'-O)-methylase SpoU
MSSDNRNVIDKYKGWELDLIREDIAKRKFPYAVAMQHIDGDFNFSTVVRNANAFGANEVFYIGGKKHWDTRGDVGARHYSHVQFLRTIDELTALKGRYVFVGLENNIERSVGIKSFVWPKNSLIIIGEERGGIVPEILDLCDYLVHIDMFGSVRSINAGCASAIAMVDYVNKVNPNE